MNAKLKAGLLAVVAALMLALPGAFSIGSDVTPALASRTGDVCGIFSSTGDHANVGEHFYVLARIQDNFYIQGTLNAQDDTDENGDDDEDPDAHANEIDGIDYQDSYVTVPLIAVDVDSQTGEAKIIDRIEDGENAYVHFADDLDAAYGDPEENNISPVDRLDSLEVLTEFAYVGGDDDDDTLDMVEFFVDKATPEAAADAAKALTDCGDPYLTGFHVTPANSEAVLTAILDCLKDDESACEELDDLLKIEDDDDDPHVNFQLDGWAMVSLTCTKPGEVKITFDPTGQGVTYLNPRSQEESLYSYFNNRAEGMSMDIECIGTSHAAKATADPDSVEIKPVGDNQSTSLISVTVMDAHNKRLDGARVSFTTNNCAVSASEKGPFTSQTAVTWTDTDTADDLDFASEHGKAGDELGAGTGEVWLQCNVAGATPGTAVVTYIVDSAGISGAGLTGTASVKVVGPPAALKIEASPATSTCGNPVKATATVVDAKGQPVSDGTLIVFTTTSATGSQGGSEGAQGAVATTDGTATITLSIDPQDAGTHTVSARTGGNDLTGAPVNLVSNSTTVSCSLAAGAAAPVVSAPSTGTGPATVSGIRPPNTGDAGLASGNGAGSTALILASSVFALSLTAIALRRRSA